MSQHVRPDVTELGAFAGFANDVGYPLPRELLTALGDEQPGQAALADSEVSLDNPRVLRP
jgi:hypothetical protein